MEVDLMHEIIKYGSMFLFLAVAVLIFSLIKEKYKIINFRWYHGMILGFVVGFFWPFMFDWLFGW